MNSPSYHDLHITTREMPRTSLADLPFRVQVSCDKTAGWTLWHVESPTRWKLLANEFAPDGKGLRLDVAGHVIVDSLPENPHA